MLLFYEGNIKKLFNTSGKDYREMNLKEKIGNVSQADLLELLHKNGNLIKRPFVIQKAKGWVGFKEKEWKEYLKV